MFTQIIHKQFDYDWLFNGKNEDYPNPEDIKVTIAGVGEAGIKQVRALEEKPYEKVCFVDFLTLLDYNVNSVSEKQDTACRKACVDCQWLFVGADLNDENAIESACRLAEYSKSVDPEYKCKSCSCIVLKKYHGTDSVKRLVEKFDHVIYVDKEAQLFLPAHIVFHPPEYIGIDFVDYHISMKNCKDIYLTQDRDTDVEVLVDRLQETIESTVKLYGIKKMNIVGESTEDVDFVCGLEAHELIMDSVDKSLNNIDEQGIFVWDCNFHEDGDGTIRASVMICAVE